jgi:hypothetical protein
VGAFLNEKTRRASERALYSTALRLVQLITTEIIPKENPQPVDRGAYRAAWKVTKLSNGAEITNSLPYASIIEYGARAENIKPGRKMIEALTEWVQRKGIAGPEPGDAMRMAWAIAQAMTKRGIFNRGGDTGLRVLEKALKRLQPILDEEYARELKRD